MVRNVIRTTRLRTSCLPCNTDPIDTVRTGQSVISYILHTIIPSTVIVYTVTADEEIAKERDVVMLLI